MRMRILVGLILLVGLITQSQRALSQRAAEPSPTPSAGPARPDPTVALASPSRETLSAALSIEDWARRDPYGFLQAALDEYDRSVRDYTCTFTKRERIAGQLSEEQVMRAMFREKPYSVRLEWVRNPDKCSRVLYVADKWSEDGEPMAVVEPQGSIARFFVSYVMRPIHGADALKSSRRPIDQFGLRNSLALTLKYARMAREQSILQLDYRGSGEVDGRETLVFERRLPFVDGGKSVWPDRVLVVHIDKEYKLPTLCEAYSDEAKKNLLGRYMTTNLKINPNLPDSTFTTQGMGLD